MNKHAEEVSTHSPAYFEFDRNAPVNPNRSDSIETKPFKQNDLVAFDYMGAKGKGVICGMASAQNIPISSKWIVHVLESTIDKSIYPFTHIVCPEPSLTKVKYI